MGNVTAYTNQSYVISIAFDEEEYENEKNSKGEAEQEIRLSKLKSKKSIMANLMQDEI